MNRPLSPWASAIALLPLVALSACVTDGTMAIGVDCEDGFCERDPAFMPSPDGGDKDGAPPEAVPMCPVTTCSLPWATCPSSKFPCDVDLLHDNDNCGGCGIRCADHYKSGDSEWTCVSGKCTLGCTWTMLNCDGDATNGCETSVSSDVNNCGDCGVKCPPEFGCRRGECYNGCTNGGRPDRCNGRCTNVAVDDMNCGTCGNVCDPPGPGAPPLPADMYYGCVGGACGQKKCAVSGRLDCNGDVSDGCEATIHTKEHCAACDDACVGNRQCIQMFTGVYACMCDDDEETLCGNECRRLDDDPQNCGGCDRVCPGLFLPHFSATCESGICGGRCAEGYADCDGLTDNGCEVNTGVDNRNCGACGNACLPDQVCSGGKCLVRPCDGGASGRPTQ